MVREDAGAQRRAGLDAARHDHRDGERQREGDGEPDDVPPRHRRGSGAHQLLEPRGCPQAPRPKPAVRHARSLSSRRRRRACSPYSPERVRAPARGARRARRPLRPRARRELGRRRAGLRRPGRAGAAGVFAVDPTSAVVDDVLAAGAELLVTHHPLLLTPGARRARRRPEGPPRAPADPRPRRPVRRAHQRRPGPRLRGQRRARRRARVCATPSRWSRRTTTRGPGSAGWASWSAR